VLGKLDFAGKGC